MGPEKLWLMTERHNPHGHTHYICTEAPFPGEEEYTRTDTVKEAIDVLAGALERAKGMRIVEQESFLEEALQHPSVKGVRK